MFRKKSDKQQKINTVPEAPKEAPPQRIPSRITDCETLVKSMFGNSSDVVIQTIETRKEKALIVFIDGLTNKDVTDRDIITPLKSRDFDGNIPLTIKSMHITVEDTQTLAGKIINGNTAIFYEKSRKAFIIDFKQWDKRSVEKPESESVTRGPMEGFTENIRTNSALIRRKIRNSQLIFEKQVLGRQTNTLIELVYIDGIVNRSILQELKYRLSTMDTDSILESGYIEQYIQEQWYSPVSGVGVTQKPDVVASKLLEGRIAVLCDGTPHVLTVPELLIEKLFTSEDYYNRIFLVSSLRLLRLFGLLISIILPGLFVGITTYNQEMLPSAFLQTLIATTQKTPLPAFLDALFLILMFELITEAGTRLPKTVGGAISIVGSLIIGQAAVSAGIVSAPMVIVIALSALSSFIVPGLTEFSMTYGLFFLFCGGTMGLIGIGTGLVIMLTHLVSTDSFGVPILSIFSTEELKDSLVRFPLRLMRYRPSSIAKDNVKRRRILGKQRWNRG